MSAYTDTHMPEVVLVRRELSKKSVRNGHWALVAVGVLMLVMVVGAVWLLAPNDLDRPAKLWRKWANNPKNILETLVILLVLGAHLAILFVGRRDRLVIGAASIAYETPLPGWLPAILTGWNLPWTRIKKVQIRLPLGTAQPTLVLNDGFRGRKILVNAWVKQGEEEPKQKPSIQDLFRYRGMPRASSFEEMKTRLEASPLIQALRAHNVPIEYPGQAATGLMFDLQSRPRTNVAMIVFLGLLAYALIDTLYIDEIYVGEYPVVIWAGAGLIAGVVALRWITDPKIPRVVSIGLAAMLGLGTAAAFYPGLLRLNQLTDGTGLVAHEYVLREHVRLVPVASDLPEVTFTRYQDYWSQFPLGSSHRLYLRRGGLGFYQLDEAPVIEAVRAYHEKKRPESRKPK